MFHYLKLRKRIYIIFNKSYNQFLISFFIFEELRNLNSIDIRTLIIPFIFSIIFLSCKDESDISCINEIVGTYQGTCRSEIGVFSGKFRIAQSTFSKENLTIKDKILNGVGAEFTVETTSDCRRINISSQRVIVNGEVAKLHGAFQFNDPILTGEITVEVGTGKVICSYDLNRRRTFLDWIKSIFRKSKKRGKNYFILNETDSKILNVPYYIQPDKVHCQATCLKMYAQFLHNNSSSVPNSDLLSVYKIKRQINESVERPGKVYANSHLNMSWWLYNHCPPYRFEKIRTRRRAEAEQFIINHIDNGFPIIASTSHAYLYASHVILIIGYTLDRDGNINYICHDPSGKYNPYAISKNSISDGITSITIGEKGPGKGVIFSSKGILRAKSNDEYNGWYFLISAKI